MHSFGKREALAFIAARRELFDAAGKSNPFAGSEWMRHFIEHIASDDWTFVASEYGDESAMLLYSRPDAPDRYTSVTNFDAALYSPLIGTAQERGRALNGLVRRIVTSHPQCEAINFAPLDAEHPDTAALTRAFVGCGWHIKRYVCFGNWYLPCAGMSFEQYLAHLDAPLYNTCAVKSKRFRAGEEGARIEIAIDPAEVDAGMKAYQRICDRNRKKPEPYPDFIHGWARICARNGWLRLGVAYIHNTPIAAQFWFTQQQRAYIFKLAYDASYARFSADMVLNAHMIQYSLENDGVREIDYLAGDDSYKRAWLPYRRERIGLMMCNPRTMRGQLLAAHQLASEARQYWLRTIRPANPIDSSMSPRAAQIFAMSDDSSPALSAPRVTA
ncbi:MAG TPA: GNAT family N-acetyltransferase [Burkholderiales bacterium]